MSSEPCVGCGWCCLSDPCDVSHRRYGYRPRCPDLFWDQAGERYVCLLMQDPLVGEETRKLLGAGQGCCAPLMTWRNEVRNRDKD